MGHASQEVIVRIAASVFLAVSLTACSSPTEVPGSPNLIGDELGGLTASLAIDRAAVGPHEEFTLTFHVANTTADTIRLATPHTCLALPHVRRDGKRIPFDGTALGCGAALTTHAFAPGFQRTTVFRLRAELYAEHPGDVDGVAAPVGSYLVQMVFETADRPALTRALVVR